MVHWLSGLHPLDLSSLDFFQWGTIISVVYYDHVESEMDLEARLHCDSSTIKETPDELCKAGEDLAHNFDLLADFELLSEKYNELCILNQEIQNSMLLEADENPTELEDEMNE
ncbi:hypothetical protein TNCV_1146231 [Trichonephila clavipes]|nr:hypothetical protein TNCV_1146231 [Trichonephila clavipes]